MKNCIIEEIEQGGYYEVHLSIPWKKNPELLKKIKKIKGIEYLRTSKLDRYWFEIEIGKCFDTEKVLDEVQKQILIYINAVQQNNLYFPE